MRLNYKIVFIVVLLCSQFSFALDQEGQKGFFGKKIDGLQEVVKQEKASIAKHEQIIQGALITLCGGLVIGPYIALYYAANMPPQLVDYIRYTLPPWTLGTYLLTGKKSMQRSQELTKEIHDELEKFSVVLSEVEHIIDRFQHTSEENEKDFISYLEALSTRNKELDDFLVDLKVHVIDTYRGNDKVNLSYSHESLGKLIALYTIMKVLEGRLSENYSTIVIEKPSLHIGIFETWNFKFHSYRAFVKYLANEFRNNSEEILQPQLESLAKNHELSKNLQKILELIVKYHKANICKAEEE